MGSMYSELGVKVLAALGAIGVLALVVLPILYVVVTGLIWAVTGHLYRL